jgi:hypothetical protein
MQNSGIAEAPFWESAGVDPLFLPVRWSAIISVVRWAVGSGPADQKSGLPTSGIGQYDYCTSSIQY